MASRREFITLSTAAALEIASIGCAPTKPTPTTESIDFSQKPADAQEIPVEPLKAVVIERAPRLTLTLNSNPGFNIYYSPTGIRRLVTVLGLSSYPDLELHFLSTVFPNSPYTILGGKACQGRVSEAYISALTQLVLPKYSPEDQVNRVDEITGEWNRLMHSEIWSAVDTLKILCEGRLTQDEQIKHEANRAIEQSRRNPPLFWIGLKPGDNFQTNPIITGAQGY